MKLLYQVGLGGRTLEQVAESYEEYREAGESARAFALELASGVTANAAVIDDRIRESLDNWEFDRLAAVDLQLLRVAVYELVHCDDVPARVTMDEAIELAREYSAEGSSKFINGVLDSVARRHAAHKLAD